MQSDDRQSRSHAVGNDRAKGLPKKANLATIQHEANVSVHSTPVSGDETEAPAAAMPPVQIQSRSAVTAER
jgi:hypothetical protein